MTESSASKVATIIEDFERQDPLAAYEGDVGAFSISTNTVHSGSKALRGHKDGGGAHIYNPNASIERGDVLSLFTYGNRSGSDLNVLFLVQDMSNFYRLNMNNMSRMTLKKVENGVTHELASIDNGQPAGSWHEWRIHPRTDGTIQVTIHDTDGSVLRDFGVENETTFDSGHVGFGDHSGFRTEYYDDVRKLPAGKIIDDFEDGDLSEYDYTDFGAGVQTDRVYEGTCALGLPVQSGSSADAQCVSTSGDLPYPSRGDSFGGYVYLPDDTDKFRYVFAAQGPNKDPDGYNVAISGLSGFAVEVDRKGEDIARTSLDGIDHTGKWLELVIDWDYDADTDTTTITATLNDKGPDGTEDNGQLVRIQGAESPSTYESGGLAFNGDKKGSDIAFDNARFFTGTATEVSAAVSTLSFIPGGNENSTEGGDPLFSSVSEILLDEHTFEFKVDEEIDLGLLGEIDISWDVLTVRAPPLFDAWGVGDMIKEQPDVNLDEATSPLPDKYSDEFPGEAHHQSRVFNDVAVEFDTTGNGSIDRDSVAVSYDGMRTMTAIEGEEINRLDAELIGAKERDGSYYFEGGALPRFERSRIVELDGTEAVQVSTIFGGFTAVAKNIINELPNYDSTLVFLHEVLGWKFEIGGEAVADIIQDIPEPIRDLVTSELQPVIALLAATPNIFTFVEFTVLPDGRRFVRLWDSSMFPKHALYMDECRFDMTRLPYQKKERLNPRFAFFLGEAATRAVTPYHAPTSSMRRTS